MGLGAITFDITNSLSEPSNVILDLLCKQPDMVQVSVNYDLDTAFI